MVRNRVGGVDGAQLVTINMEKLKLPMHGGDIQWALAHFGGQAADWLDLSTGISPWSWPVPPVPQSVWQQLPAADDSVLRRAAATYYGCAQRCVLPVPGSQFAVAQCPRLLAPGSVAVPDPGYSEHAHAWQAAGHRLVYYRSQMELADLIETGKVCHAVVINPNNPTAEVIEPERLLAWSRQLDCRYGLLLVDEAFGDCRPELSLAPGLPVTNLIVLRSLGKFFGLAGLRLGFVLADPAWIDRLETLCQPWQVSGPAQWIGARALTDGDWQAGQRVRLARASADLQSVLQLFLENLSVNESGGPELTGLEVKLARTDLFATFSGPASILYPVFLRAAARRTLLRFGYTANEAAWLRIGLSGSSMSALKDRLGPVFSAINNGKIL